jgi:hypothetical protein
MDLITIQDLSREILTPAFIFLMLIMYFYYCVKIALFLWPKKKLKPDITYPNNIKNQYCTEMKPKTDVDFYKNIFKRIRDILDDTPQRSDNDFITDLDHDQDEALNKIYNLLKNYNL